MDPWDDATGLQALANFYDGIPEPGVKEGNALLTNTARDVRLF